MFDLVFEHQQQRITTYHAWLTQAFGTHGTAPSFPRVELPSLSESLAALQFPLKRRKWTDDKGLEYDLTVASLSDLSEDESSVATLTASSLASVNDGVERLFRDVGTLCQTPKSVSTNLLKQIMCNGFHLWKGARTQSAMRTHLLRYFENDPKRRKDAQKALLCLCRVYHCVYNFIEAAEKLQISNSFKWIAIAYQPLNLPGTSLHPPSPLSVARRLGLTISGNAWTSFFIREAPKFRNLVNERRQKSNVHAEIQAIFFHYLYSSAHEKKHTHPYIGCSRHCCSLCYLFILIHGEFRVRCTHETILHRWNLPARHVKGENEALLKVRSTTRRLLDTLKNILRELFKEPRPPTRREQLAQSSAALSSAQIAAEKESAPLERSHREVEYETQSSHQMRNKADLIKTANDDAHCFRRLYSHFERSTEARPCFRDRKTPFKRKRNDVRGCRAAEG